MQYKILYLPVETKSREFLAKLLLSVKAVEKGWIVFLGYSNTMKAVMHRFLPGVHVFASIPDHKYEKHLLPYSKLGHKMINICEESVQYVDGKDYCDRKVGIRALGLTSKFLAVGQRQANHVKEYRSVTEDQLVITGNPRFDLLRPGFRNIYLDDAERIKNRYGRFVLVNTNFAKCNPHPYYGDRLSVLKNKNYISSAEQEKIWKGLTDYKTGLMREFMEFIPELTAKFDCKVIVRPHPSENHDVWKRWTKNHNNVFMAHEGSANEWMLAAEAVIHNGCTTGVEAFLLERPVIAYVPDPDNTFSKDIVNDVSFQVHNKQQILDVVAKVLHAGRLDNAQERREKINKLKNVIENVDGPLACDLIVEEIGKLDVPDYSRKTLRGHFDLSDSFIFGTKMLLRKIRHLLTGKKIKINLNQQKYPGISPGDMEHPLAVWKRENVISAVPAIQKMNENIFYLYRKP